MKRACIGSAGVLVLLLVLLLKLAVPGVDRGGQDLFLYCAAGLKKPVEELVQRFEAEHGVPVPIQFGGSQTLLSGLEISKRGDLYLPADEAYVDLADQKGLTTESLSLARMTAVLAVPKDNPQNLRTLAQALNAELRISQALPETAAIGRLTRQHLAESGIWDQLEQRTIVFKPAVNDVANDVLLGTADAGIVWDAVVRQYPGLELVRAPELSQIQAEVRVAVLRTSRHPELAQSLAQWLASDENRPVWLKHGYELVAEPQ